MATQVDLIVTNATQLLTMVEERARCTADDLEARALGVIENGSVAVKDSLIVQVGTTDEIRETYEAPLSIDASNCIVTPGLVDPHTHIVFGGARHLEFGMRMRGATYLEILAAGGGIHSTVASTREASLDSLVASAGARLNTALSFGVTTMEVKSGYGLNLQSELKMLKAVRALSERGPIRLVPTFLGAHVVPGEYKDKRSDYVSLVIDNMIPAVADDKLAVACDVFLDNGAFERDEASAILEAAKNAGLAPKIHAGQFTEQHGPELVAKLGGLSSDHMEIVSDDGLAAMAEAGVVSNLLPGAAFSLRDHFPNGRRMIDAGVKVAVATDNNPGTSRSENLPLMASMAVTRMGLTCAEAWQAITTNAAKSLALEAEIGSVDPGKRADLAIFSIPDFRSLLYHFGINHTQAVVANGNVVWEK